MNNEQAIQLLTDLGSDTDQIARSLREQGIKGNMGRCYSCPIAQFLIKNGAQYGACMVSGMIRFASGGPDGEWNEAFKTPSAIASFIDSFDAGAYPELRS